MHLICLTVAVVLVLTNLGLGQAPLEIPDGGRNVLAEGGVAAFRLTGSGSNRASATTVDVSGQPFAQALRLRTDVAADSPWLIQAQARSAIPLEKGDVCLVAFSARAVETSNEMSEATLGVVFEHAGAPHTKSLTKALKLNNQWRQFYLPFMMATSEAAGQAQCNLQVGYLPQTIEVADFQLLTFAKTRRLDELPMQGSQVSYAGREADAPWRRAAAERIEKHRMAQLSVVVTDAQGNAIRDAEVHVAMQRHAYHFGAAVTAQLLTADTPDAKRYRELVSDCFNAVVLENDLKFSPWNNGKTSARSANFNNQNTLQALRWLQENRIFVRGHCLLWGPLDLRHYPAARGFDFDAADTSHNRTIIEAHIDDILKATDGLIGEWDVVNHPVATWGDKGRCWTDLFGPEFYADLFRKARAANPAQRRYINEGGILPGHNEGVRRRYEQIIAWLLEHDAPVDGIGFMGHFGASTLATPEALYAHLERYGKFGLPMQITEFDVATDGDEQLQADYLRDFMTVVFSHPQTDGIIMWGFWEGRHWKPDTALWRRAWELKPNGQAWLDLVKQQWWTDTTGRTDAQGRFIVRGFKGDYVIRVTAAGKSADAEVVLSDDAAECIVRLP